MKRVTEDVSEDRSGSYVIYSATGGFSTEGPCIHTSDRSVLQSIANRLDDMIVVECAVLCELIDFVWPEEIGGEG